MFDSTKHSCRASLDLLKIRHRTKQQKIKQLQQEADEQISKGAAFVEWQAAQQQYDQYLSLRTLYGSPASTQGEELATTASLAQGSIPPTLAHLQELQAHARAQSGQHAATPSGEQAFQDQLAILIAMQQQAQWQRQWQQQWLQQQQEKEILMRLIQVLMIDQSRAGSHVVSSIP